jgi:hypothetical protein
VPVAGHSLHRWLVGIPVILYAATVILFGLYAYDPSATWLRDAIFANLLAVLVVPIVAAPGLFDALAIPRAHPARNVAIGHGSLMVTVATLFVVNLAVHYRLLASALKGSMALQRGFDATVPLVVTGTALALAVFGGALGVMLAHRYHVGDVAAEGHHPPGAMLPPLP